MLLLTKACCNIVAMQFKSIVRCCSSYNLMILNAKAGCRFKNAFFSKRANFIKAAPLLGWLGFSSEDEHKDSELVTSIKRAILCWQNDQFDVAEQILHVALQLAQQLQHRNGVLYCYDIMANLALSRNEYEKSEKLFIYILHELMSIEKMECTDPKAISICLKLARIKHMEGRKKDAVVMFKRTLGVLSPIKDENSDTKLMYGVAEMWYSQVISELGQIAICEEHLEMAYDTCKDLDGKDLPQLMVLFNDMGSICFQIGRYSTARKYLNHAVKIGEEINDLKYLGVIQANYGVILAYIGLLEEAKEYCTSALSFGQKVENDEIIAQANYCFDRLKNVSNQETV